MNPVATKRLPCANCAFLKPVYLRNSREECKFYAKCTYQPPIVPTAYWQYQQPYSEPAQWRTLLHINGPFSPNAEDVVCEVKEPSA